MSSPQSYYRIVEIKNGRLFSLFHGTNGSRELPVGVWIKAEKKDVRDGSGGTRYPSGFHVFKTYEDAETFTKKRLVKEGRIIVKCRAKGVRRKTHSPSRIYLADSICIPLLGAKEQYHEL